MPREEAEMAKNTFEEKMRENCKFSGLTIKKFSAEATPDPSSPWGDWGLALEATLEVTEYRETGTLDLIEYSFDRLLREAALGKTDAYWDFCGETEVRYETFVPTGKYWSGIDYIGERKKEIPGNGTIITIRMKGPLSNVGWSDPRKGEGVRFTF